MLCFAFALAGFTFVTYLNESNFAPTSSAGSAVNLNSLVEAVVVVMILGIMGWLGSILLLRGLDFAKYERQLAAEKQAELRASGATVGAATTPIVNATSSTTKEDSTPEDESVERPSGRKRLYFNQPK